MDPVLLATMVLLSVLHLFLLALVVVWGVVLARGALALLWGLSLAAWTTLRAVPGLYAHAMRTGLAQATAPFGRPRVSPRTPLQRAGGGAVPVEEDADARREEATCVVCMERRRALAPVDCGHRCLCGTCARELCRRGGPCCPVCREPVTRLVRVYG